MYVSKELALILRDKGFNYVGIDVTFVSAIKAYDKDGNLIQALKGNVVEGYTLAPTEHEIVDWIFKQEYFYFEEYVNDYRDIERQHWLQFWYNTLLEHKFSLMYEFIGRLEEWFENNGYLLIVKHYKDNWYEWIIQCFTNCDIDGKVWNKSIECEINLTTKQQAKHEAILKCFELVKENDNGNI